jgi:hypothetical protein
LNEAEPSRAGDHDVLVVVSAAEATLEPWPRVPWALVALAAPEEVVTAAVPEVSMVDAVVVVTEEALAVVEEASEAAAVISVAVVTEADTALLVMLPLDLVSIAGTAAMATATEVTEVIEATEGVTEAPVGMIHEAVVAHMTTDTAVAIATVADSAENARTDAPEATMNPSADEKVGIAKGTETTTDLVMTTVAVSAVMTVATKIPESCDVTEQSSSWTHMWWVVDLIFQSLIHPLFHQRVSTPLLTTTPEFQTI